jgi:hypothetical protein
MDMLKSLLKNLGRMWRQEPDEKPFFRISKDSGTHTMVTIENDQLVFHSVPYHEAMPQKQVVDLNGMDFGNLAAVVRGMGYGCDINGFQMNLSEANIISMYHLVEIRNVVLTPTSSGAVYFNYFTAPNWQLLYPIYRLLRKAESDIEVAVNQMYLPTSRGKWLDYWGTFFGVRRTATEDDNRYVRRILMYAFSPKVNNTAMEEIISFQMNSEVEVNDLVPLLFEVVMDADIIQYKTDTVKVIEDCKAAGVAYLLRYKKEFTEDYPIYFADVRGFDLSKADGAPSIELYREETIYGWQTYSGFDLNSSELNSSFEIGGIQYTVKESGSMTMTKAGVVQKSMTW